MSIKDQQAGGPTHAAQGHQDYGPQGQRPRQAAPRPRAATGLAAGSTMFARMPAYTPVTRAPEQPYPQDPGYDTQPAANGYYDETAQGGAYQGQAYADEQGYEAQGYEAQPYGDQAYAEQPYPEQPYGEQAYAQQPYDEAGYQDASQDYGQAYQNGAYHDAAMAGDEPLDLGMEEGAGYAEQPPVEQTFEAYGDEQAAYGEQDPAQAGYDTYAPAGDAYGAEPEPAAYSNGQAYGDDQAYAEQPYGEQAYDPNAYDAQAYSEAQYPQGEYAPHDPSQAVQTYEAQYDQAPEIPLSYGQPGAEYQETEPQADADFMGAESESGSKLAAAGVFSKYLSRKSAFMLGGAVLGAIALGGALAFAFKQSGGGLASNGEPPLITAENTPVKEAPEQPGGKEFPHKNKLIYDRLENGDQPEADRLVPREEELALPNMPAQTDMPNMPELASAEGAEAGANAGTPAAAESSDPDAGPRKVKTLTVRPDGSVDGATATANADAAGAQGSEPTTTASIEPQSEPEAAPAPAVNKKYVVQVASKKDQTEALAAFADMQQKYPSLLSNYRPMVQRVNLGSKGVWYRLQVGPMNSQADASQLCGQLKSQGLNDCLVMAQ